ncbi:MAG: hypothetical protein Tsb0020_09370 [Haliangiales bacterium]
MSQPSLNRIACLLAALLTLLHGAAVADPRLKDAVVRYEVPANGGTYTIHVHPDVVTKLRFGDVVTGIVALQQPALTIEWHQQFYTVMMAPTADFEQSSMSISTGEYLVSLLVQKVDRIEDADPVVEFDNKQAERALRERIEREVTVAREDEAAKWRARAHRDLAEQLLGSTELRVNTLLVTESEPVETPALGQVALAEIIRHTQHGQDIRHAQFHISNDSDQPMRLTELRFRAENGEMVTAELVLFRVTGDEYRTFPLELSPRQTITGIARVPDDAGIPTKGLTIAVDGPALLTPLVTEAQSLAALDTFEEEYRRIRERERAEKARRARGEQTIVSGVARGGAYFVRDGVDGSEQLDAATTWVVGGRVTKGLAEPIAFEVEVVGGRADGGQFRDVERDGAIGDIERSASFGRIALGATLRLGDISIPFAYMGVGVQFASYTSTFTSDGQSVSGPGDGFELAGFVSAGGGIDYRLGGGGFVVGLRASYLQLAGGERAIDAGVQLGVGL